MAQGRPKVANALFIYQLEPQMSKLVGVCICSNSMHFCVYTVERDAFLQHTQTPLKQGSPGIRLCRDI